MLLEHLCVQNSIAYTSIFSWFSQLSCYIQFQYYSVGESTHAHANAQNLLTCIHADIFTYPYTDEWAKAHAHICAHSSLSKGKFYPKYIRRAHIFLWSFVVASLCRVLDSHSTFFQIKRERTTLTTFLLQRRLLLFKILSTYQHTHIKHYYYATFHNEALIALLIRLLLIVVWIFMSIWSCKHFF